MPTELEELVEFLHHGNTQVRQIACENLVGYSSDAKLFKAHQLLPVKDLKLLVRDYAPISKNALTILINLSAHDAEILTNLATDSPFLETLLLRITSPSEPNANEIAMLLANLAKSDSLSRILTLTRAVPQSTSTSAIAMDQLMDLFVKGSGSNETPKPTANFDYLAYLFADLSKHKAGRAYFVSPRPYDTVVPITKLTPFTEHASHIRRAGVASTLKNCAFEISAHAMLLDSSTAESANLLPYILLPLAGSEEYPDSESASMLPDLQLLPPDKKRDPDPDILTTHLDTLLLLTTTRAGRDLQRSVGVYPVVRECHLAVEDEGVREACDRLVQVLLRDEEGEGESTEPKVQEVADDEDERIEEVF